MRNDSKTKLTGFERTAVYEHSEQIISDIMNTMQDTDGQRELIRIPSLAWTMASSRVIARTPP